MKNNPFIIGIIAALAFTGLMVMFSGLGFFVLIPVFLGALPIYVAALGWGTRAGVVATLAIVIFASLLSDLSSGLLIGMMIAAPASLAGHQANLAQTNSNGGGELQWYPFSRILFSISLLIVAAVLFFGLMVDFDPAVLGPQIADQLKPFLPQVEGRPELSAEDIGKAFELNLQLLPFILPSLWIGIHVLNLLLGIYITRSLKVLARPKEDIAAEFNLPQFSLVLLAVSFAGMSISPAPISYAFAVVAGAMLMAFSIVGLAVLHERTRGWSGRTPLLVLTYLLIILVFFPVYLFSFAGILKAVRKNILNRN